MFITQAKFEAGPTKYKGATDARQVDYTLSWQPARRLNVSTKIAAARRDDVSKANRLTVHTEESCRHENLQETREGG